MPSEGTACVRGIDMWTEPLKAAHLGVLLDGVHLFDKLTGERLISGYLHGIDKETVASRVKRPAHRNGPDRRCGSCRCHSPPV